MFWYNKFVKKNRIAVKGESYMLKYNVRGENIEVTDALRSYVEKRLNKLEKYFELNQDVIAHVKDRKSTRLNSSHVSISYAVFCLKKKKKVTFICNLLILIID